MKPLVTGIVLIALFSNMFCYGQNNTPMEVLVNIANEHSRFVPQQVFIEDHRNTDYLDTYLENYISLKLNKPLLQEIVSKGLPNIAISFPLPEGKSLNAKLVNFDIRAEGFSVVDAAENELEIPDAQFYRGILEREIDATAGISFFNDQVYGLFSSVKKGNIVLAQDPINPGDGENYIVYFENDLLIDRSLTCGADLLQPLGDFQFVNTRNNSKVYSTCEDIDVFIQATYQLFSEKGSEVATTNYITAFFNNVSIIYRNESIYTSIKKIKINTTEDAFSNLSTAFEKLNRFGQETQNNYFQYSAELAHLIDYNENGLGGIAWINAMCSNYRYNSSRNEHSGGYAYSSINNTYEDFPDYSLTVLMFTHEMGHNLGSQHTQWCGWSNGPIDNCASIEGTCIPMPGPGPQPVNGGTIMSYCHLTAYGTNFSNGFGVEPGNLIRTKVQSNTCTEQNIPKELVSCVPLLTVIANRECTDKDGWTHYYNDLNTTDETDDDLLLSVLKGNEDIGNLDDGSLMVSVKTSSNAGNGATHIDNPGYTADDDWYVMNRWFELIPTQEPENPVTVRFPYTVYDYVDVVQKQPTVNTHNDLIFYKINAPGDPNPDNGHTNISNNDITFYNNSSTASLTTWKYERISSKSHIAEFKVSSFSGGGGGFSGNNQGVVPVEILSFDVKKEAQSVRANWASSLEVNNDYYTLEKSINGIDFQQIGNIIGVGNSSEKEDYSFLDREPYSGINYYRLSQTDKDGSHKFIGIRTIKMDFLRTVNIYPNPLERGNLHVDYKLTQSDDISVTIRNIEGRRVYHAKERSDAGENHLRLDLSHLDAGMYIIEVEGKDNTYTQKLIKD